MKRNVNGNRKRSIHRFDNDGIDTLELPGKDVRKKRSCLMCGQIFNSKSSGNRRCLHCDRLLLLRARDGYNMHIEYTVALPFSENVETWNGLIC
ncbi:MAG: hypothetical protein ACUZ8E_14540 [Candidatus Anammoxibacter sp.]